MDQILTGNIWKQIAPSAQRANRRLAALAYVSNGDLLRLEHGDTLVCDASDHAISLGNTSAPVLRKFHRKGVRLYNHPDLHAKVVLFGKNALIGSCNLPQSSASILREAALLSTRSSVRSQVSAFIYMTKK